MSSGESGHIAQVKPIVQQRETAKATKVAEKGGPRAVGKVAPRLPAEQPGTVSNQVLETKKNAKVGHS